MVINMTTQNYCLVNESTNVVDNVCVWDGNPDTWQPPAGYITLAQATTLAKIWLWNAEQNQWILTVQEGAGNIGFTWDGEYLNTPDPMPPKPIPSQQPATEGTQTL